MGNPQMAMRWSLVAGWALFLLVRVDFGAAQNASVVVCDEFAQCCYANCECNYCWRHDAVCQVDVPQYGAGTTMLNGQKYCPGFQPDSPVCATDSMCYFWTKESGGEKYNCPSAACDAIIIDYCGGLGYVHPSEQQTALPALSNLDIGCAPLIRLGIEPFSDWAQERDVETSPATAEAWPAAYTSRSGRGDTVGVSSYYQIDLTFSTAPTDLSSLRNNLAEAISLDRYFVHVSGTDTAVTAKVYMAETAVSTTAQTAVSRITTGAYKTQESMNSYSITSSAYIYKQMTSTCYCKDPSTAPAECGAGYDAGSPTCTIDNVTSTYLSSIDARSGVESLEAGDFSKAGDMMVGGIVVGAVLIGSLGVIWIVVMHADSI